MKQEPYDIWYPSKGECGPTRNPKAYKTGKEEDLPKCKQDPLQFFQQQRKKIILGKENPNNPFIYHGKLIFYKGSRQLAI